MATRWGVKCFLLDSKVISLARVSAEEAGTGVLSSSIVLCILGTVGS